LRALTNWHFSRARFAWQLPLLFVILACTAAEDDDDEPLFALATSHFDDSKGCVREQSD
jgi:hypothetical protein